MLISALANSSIQKISGFKTVVRYQKLRNYWPAETYTRGESCKINMFFIKKLNKRYLEKEIL